MNLEIKNKWIAALRSGEYEQGRGRLRTGNQFCCMGVLCDLHAKAGFGEWKSDDEWKTVQYAYAVNSQPNVKLSRTTTVPTQVLEWAGVSSSSESELIDYNDVDRRSFSEIADIIEEGFFMYESIDLGPTPHEESCEQVGPNCDYRKMRRECAVFARQIAREMGEPPLGASIRVAVHPHDFGTYYSVEVRYDALCPKAVEYAFRVEDASIPKWDMIAQKELVE